MNSHPEGITRTVDDYFLGMYEGDVERLRDAFDATARLHGYFKGRMTNLALEDWLKSIAAAPSPKSKGEAFDMRIVSVDVAGDVAVAKVADLYRGLRFTDYLTLLRREDRWVIVSKAFHHDPVSP